MQMVATLKQYSAMRNISVYRLRQLAKNGVITAGIVGNKYLLNVEAVDRYFEELLAPKPKPAPVKRSGQRQKGETPADFFERRKREILASMYERRKEA